jgi:CheY-like chemotaxis protein
VSDDLIAKLIDTAPAVLWVVFALIVFLSVRKVLLPQLARLSTVKAGVVEFAFAARLIDTATAQAEGSARVGAGERRAVVDRLDHAADFLRGGRLLWVDDRPELNSALEELLRAYGVTVDNARTSSEATEKMRRGAYDVIVSDMNRDGERDAGYGLARAIAAAGDSAPLLIYSDGVDPEHGMPYVFGWTNRADDLIHYVIDVMERAHFGRTGRA